METILSVKNIIKSFNGFKAVDDVSFEVEKGDITCLIGENGAGKTTLFNVLCGFEKQKTGNIFFNGRNISHLSAFSRAKFGIGRLFQQPHIFKNLSVIDNLLASTHYHAGEKVLNYLFRLGEIRRTEKINSKKALQILSSIGLIDMAENPAFMLSYGQKKLLSIGMLLMNDAQIILLDEPYAGLNILMIKNVNSIIENLSAGGITFIIIEHNVKMVQSISHKLLRMSNGRLLENKELLSANGSLFAPKTLTQLYRNRE